MRRNCRQTHPRQTVGRIRSLVYVQNKNRRRGFAVFKKKNTPHLPPPQPDRRATFQTSTNQPAQHISRHNGTSFHFNPIKELPSSTNTHRPGPKATQNEKDGPHNYYTPYNWSRAVTLHSFPIHNSPILFFHTKSSSAPPRARETIGTNRPVTQQNPVGGRPRSRRGRPTAFSFSLRRGPRALTLWRITNGRA